MVFNVVLVGFNVSTTKGGFAVVDENGVKHAIAVEEVVGPTGEILRVGAVSYVGPVEGGREGALDDVAGRRGEFVDWGEVVGEDVFWVNGGFDWWVNEGVDDGIK